MASNRFHWNQPTDSQHSSPPSVIVLPTFCFWNLVRYRVFTKRMMQVFEGQKGVICTRGDTLVFGAKQKKHNCHLLSVLNQTKKAGSTLKLARCQLCRTDICFCGYTIDQTGVYPDPGKVAWGTFTNVCGAFTKQCKTERELWCFPSMTTQLGRFTPNLAKTVVDAGILLNREHLTPLRPKSVALLFLINMIPVSRPASLWKHPP